MTIKETATHAARVGGEVLLKYFRTDITMRHKGAVDLVSDADVNAERAIVEVIRSAWPDHNILGEEEQADEVDAEHLWVIDPLDGTTNFAHQISHFAVSIAYYRDGVAECGVVYSPVHEDWYIAERGQGAFCNGDAMQVGAQAKMNEVLIGVGFYYDRGAMMEATLAAMRDCFGTGIHGIRRMGTASLDLVQVACGQFGAYFEYELSPWDFAAGAIDRGRSRRPCSTCSGDPLPLRKTSVLASNGLLHDAVLQIAERHLP